ncbi:hypothetical protein DVH24_028347 [Malus domestica]|uniref:Alpha/beta hydrolase fold-3 domain-containing protein n=1 Tax=Malus domestica TaxID=3750 RepID=A0A498HBI1_MALDO|nr:hypothetical protein DVH24_028347 [Malus domestica]
MAARSLDPRLNLQATRKPNQHGVVLKEIEVERPPMIPSVHSTLALPPGVVAKDVVMDKFTNTYLCSKPPQNPPPKKKIFCSVNYPLAPDNRLPAAYDDGFKALMWVKQQALNECGEQKWWLSKCSLSSLLIGGDSAVANIAYNVTTQLGSYDPSILRPLSLKGTARTWSEKCATQPLYSALTLPNSNTYWRLSLPLRASIDHPRCNPLAKASVAKLCDLSLPSMMVCVSELDILKDRNFELRRVEQHGEKGGNYNAQRSWTCIPSSA